MNRTAGVVRLYEGQRSHAGKPLYAKARNISGIIESQGEADQYPLSAPLQGLSNAVLVRLVAALHVDHVWFNVRLNPSPSRNIRAV